MAKIGLLYPRYCPITITQDENGRDVESYGTVKTFAKAIRANTSLNITKVDLYADDDLSETANEFVNGQMTFEADDIEDEVEAEVTGAKVEEGGDIVHSTMDVAPYLRYGFLVRRYKSRNSQYRGIIFTKTVFDAIPDDYETKGQSIVFKTTTLTARFYGNASGHWKRQSKWFDTLQEAEMWMNQKLKPTEQA
jgi:phi13 family phage major tail protein